MAASLPGDGAARLLRARRLRPLRPSGGRAARRILRDHFRARVAEDADARLAKWIAEKSYPFAADDTSPERAAFDAGVTEMRAHLDSFDSLPTSERTYLFTLLRKSLGGRA